MLFFLLGRSIDNIVQYYRSTCSLVHVPVRLIEDILNQVAYCFWIVAGLVIVSVIKYILVGTCSLILRHYSVNIHLNTKF